MISKALLDSIVDKVMATMLMVFGAIFIYVPASEIANSIPRQSTLTEAQKADFSSIALKDNQDSVSAAVEKLLSRNDIVRVHITKGDYTYPEIEVKRGKDETKYRIGFWTHMNINGYSANIAYASTEKTSMGTLSEMKAVIMSLGCLLLGILAVFWGFVSIMIPRKYRTPSKETEFVKPIVPPPAPTPDPEPSPIRYERPRIVK